MIKLQMPTAATIMEVHSENFRTKTFMLDARMDGYPGQFAMVWLPRFDEKPFSMVDTNPVTLMVAAVGPFTQLMHRLAPGDRLWLRGPFGHGFQVAEGDQHPLLVGGGYGVAPLLWLGRQLRDAGRNLHVVIGARRSEDLLYVDRFEDLGMWPHPDESGSAGTSSLELTTEDGSVGRRGLVTEPVTALLAAGRVDSIFACGPHGMLHALQRLSRQYHVPAQLSWEAYMRCGMGICGACEHDGRVLCLDGPVLPVPS